MLRAVLIGPEDSFLREVIDQMAFLKDVELCRHVAEYLPPAELIGLLEEAAPDLVIIHLADYDRARRSISRILQVNPHLPVVAAHYSCDQRLLLELMQLGVRELWFSPLDAELMQQTVKRVHQKKTAPGLLPGPELSALGKLIAFLPARGGCGTTTIAVHTAAALGKLKGSVLLADFDFHNSVISFWMKVAPRYGFQEALERARWLDLSVWKNMVIKVGELELLTAPQTSTPLVFSGAETSAVLEFVRQNYQFVLVDLPEAIYSSCWEVLDQADQILLVSTAEMGSLYLARRKIAQVLDHGIPRSRIRLLLNRNAPGDLQPAEVEKFLGLPVLISFANQYRSLANAFAKGAFIAESSKLGAQFLHFAHSLTGDSKPAARKAQSASWKLRQFFSPTASKPA